MLQYPLYDFLSTVPSCLETTTLAVVLEILTKEQCDRLVVVNSQQYPIGLLYAARLLPRLLAGTTGEKFLNLWQTLSVAGQTLIEPIQTIPAAESVEKFSLFLRYQPSQQQKNIDWALIDDEGKFLGVLDTTKLMRSLAKEKIALNNTNTKIMSLDAPEVKNSSRYPGQTEHQKIIYQPLIDLLARLPWPLMLQTGSSEIITQNPSWRQQLGVLKNAESVREQVEMALTACLTQLPQYSSTAISLDYQKRGQEEKTSGKKLPPLSNHRSYSLSALPLLQKPPIPAPSKPNYCFLDTHLNACTCILEAENGQERVWQFTKIPLDHSAYHSPEHDLDEPLSSHELWLVLATDVTEKQQLYKELAAKNADLIQLNRLKDEFLACISHELKTPLTAVLGLSRLLVDRQMGELNERQARYASLIHQSGRHLMSVVNDILDLTRMETGQMELSLAPVKIQAVCERALSEVKNFYNQHSKNSSQAKENKHQSTHLFSLDIEAGLEQMVADELRLRQMLVHLLSNAFKFTEISGEIGLKVSRWEGWIAFTVWDTGIGIPEHQQHLIFQKFQQLENPLTRQFEGTGLGLVLTRALARLHGGDVSFLSSEGKGSQFTLLLPPSPPNTNFVETDVGEFVEESINNSDRESSISPLYRFGNTPQPQSSCSQRLVLVVEAVACYIEDLTEHLKAIGYQVVIARSGTEALEKARRLQPKAIFLNPLLPLLSGWDVLTLLKSDAVTRHIPVIITATGAEKEQAFANEANGFISLPVELQVLKPLLERLCGNLEIKSLGLENQEIISTRTPLRILRLVNHSLDDVHTHSSLREHRVIEVDDLDQAELLARVWRFDVLLLDVENTIAQNYLQKLPRHPRLAKLPLVTCDVNTTLAASKIPGLCVFPCLTPLHSETGESNNKTDALLSVLQIAAGIACPPNIMVVDMGMLQDLSAARRKTIKSERVAKSNSPNNETTARGSEWFQALIQYLQTAGMKATMGECWAEVLQQISHQSLDLLLICLGNDAVTKDVQKAIKSLATLPQLPPVLIIDHRHQSMLDANNEPVQKRSTTSKDNAIASLKKMTIGITTQILPRSISMEDLLKEIRQALVIGY